jgi:hypothetical protein
VQGISIPETLHLSINQALLRAQEWAVLRRIKTRQREAVITRQIVAEISPAIKD